MRTNKLLYVAGPYSIGDPQENIRRAEMVSVNLLRSGFHVITPHKNTAGYEKYEDGNLTYETWIKLDLDLLSRCDAIYVMVNSEISHGVKKEIEFARAMGMPVIYEADYPSGEFTYADYLEIQKVVTEDEIKERIYVAYLMYKHFPDVNAARPLFMKILKKNKPDLYNGNKPSNEIIKDVEAYLFKDAQEQSRNVKSCSTQ